ncbi:mitochondrial ATP synthase epsilon chain-domain-containing protein [Scheffersomyces xylosifermentans]|uniref:mitochondrial ATP synthase epsilon chain-domain-containing protein n=1 Tax=Scheffersomyces xylosifermentans TaxID=1304137 RepID=UPI00315CFEB5
MSAYKQVGISLNKALSIAARTVRESLKPEFKAAAERRGFTEAKVIKVENGVQSEPKPLGK